MTRYVVQHLQLDEKVYMKNKAIRLGGGSGPGSDQYFAGWMDDVRIFDKALNSTEVASLFNE